MGWVIGKIAGFLGDLITDLFSVLNYFIYSFIEDVYNFLMSLTDVQIFDNQVLKAFSTRIYAILGVFMAFKLMFTFITYAVNPDTLTDKSKGGQKLIVNIMVSLVLLIAVPNLIFPLSRELQTAVLNDHILEQVILGVKTSSSADVGTTAIDTKQAGRYLSFSVLNGFFHPSPSLKSSSGSCANTTMILDESVDPDPSKQEGLENALYKMDGDCATAILELVDDNPGDAVYQYETAYSQKSISMLLGGEDSTNLKQVKTNAGDSVFKFNYLISLVTGCIVVWMLIHFCFDIALRTIKLGFLELIAPIPILSYIDTHTKKTFQAWMKECGKTYADLFIRLAALYFAVFVIMTMVTGTGLTYSSTGKPIGGLTMIVIILGALMFANKVPELIGSLFGFKLGNFSLNPFKNSPLAAGAVGAVTGGVGGALAGVKAGAQVGAPFRGFTSGFFSGMGTGYKTKVGSGSFKKSMDTAYQNLTGNHYEHMSLGRLFMSYKGTGRVGEMTDALNTAYTQLQANQTALNVASHTSAELSNELRRNGIDVSNMNDARRVANENAATASAQRTVAQAARDTAQANFDTAQLRRGEAQATVDSIQADYNRAQQIVNAANAMNVPEHMNPYYTSGEYQRAQDILSRYGEEYRRAQEELNRYDTTAAQAELDRATREFNEAERVYQSSQIQISNLQRYETAIQTEAKIRKEIAGIEKNIATVKDEKAQREKFYGVDSSPKQQLSKALNEIESRRNTNNNQ